MTGKLIWMTVLVVGLNACSNQSHITKHFSDSDIIHYSQMKSDNDLFQKVIYLNKGDKIPVEIEVESRVVGVENKSLNLVLKEKVFLHMVIPGGVNLKKVDNFSEKKKQEIIKQSMFYVSADARTWARYTDLKSSKKLFGVGGGSLSIGFGVSKIDGPKLNVSASTRDSERK